LLFASADGDIEAVTSGEGESWGSLWGVVNSHIPLGWVTGASHWFCQAPDSSVVCEYT